MNEKTGKAILVKMPIKKGDKVMVTAGDNKGQVSEVMEVCGGLQRASPSKKAASPAPTRPPCRQVFRKTGLVKVKDVNVVTKHNKPRQEGEKGSITKFEAPIHHSNVQLVTKDGKVSRVAKKCVRPPPSVARGARPPVLTAARMVAGSLTTVSQRSGCW